MATIDTAGRANQKARTRKAIVDACRELARSGADVTMPQIARAAMVSEATAYRYFPDLVSLLQESITDLRPPLAEIFAPVDESLDPAERIAFACDYLMRVAYTYRGAVRAMIAHTIATPGAARARPGIRFGLIDYALSPFQNTPALARLKQELAVVVSSESLFVLLDLCGLDLEEAIAIAVRAAGTLTRAAFPGLYE